MENIEFKAYNKTTGCIYNVEAISFKLSCVWINGVKQYFDNIELMQYVGLKDKNRNPLYKHDIIKCHGDLYEIMYNEVTLEWSAVKIDEIKDGLPEKSILFPLRIIRDNWADISQEKWELVGNRYTHPDLYDNN